MCLGSSFFSILLLKSLTVAMVMCDDNEYRLLGDLLHSYDPRIRPSTNASHPLNVTFGLALSQIIDVDEKNQIITTNCWLNQAWIDYKLVWDPLKYGGVRVLRLPYDVIWKPDILLYNNADVSSYKSSISTNVIVTSDGNVTWLSMVIFRSSCSVDVKFFPFDEQNCSMQFGSWTYDGFQVNLVKVGEDGDVSNYIPNTEWALMRLHAVRKVVYYSCCAEPYPDVTYTIQIRRKPLFYVFNMILPCFLITLVALLGFYIPSDSGEKVSMGITTLLSMTVFLMLVAENMPPTSDVLPLVGLYYGITIAIVSLATTMTVFTLNIHHMGQEGRPVPRILRFLFLRIFARILFLNLRYPETETEKTFQEMTSSDASPSNHSRLYFNTNRSRPKNKMTGAEKCEGGLGGGQVLLSLLDFLPTKDPTTSEDLSDSNDPESTLERYPENGGLPQPTAFAITSPGGATMTSPSRHHHHHHHHHHRHHRQTTSGGGAGETLAAEISRTLGRVSQTISRNEIRLAEQEVRARNRRDWQQVALVVDRMLLVVFTVGTVGITLGILLHAPLSRDFLFGGSGSGSGPAAIEGRNAT